MLCTGGLQFFGVCGHMIQIHLTKGNFPGFCGGSFAGGKGKISGALFGILFISLLSNMFNLWEVKSMFQNMTLGLVLIAVLTLDGWLSIRRLRNLGKI